MASLALAASPPQKPPETRPGDQHVLYEPVVPGPGSATVGPFAAPRPTGRALAVEENEIQGSGQVEMLRPGGLWATTSDSKSDTFEARLQPARRIQIDSVMIPHIAGSVDITLFSPRTDITIDNVTSSHLLRFDQPRTLNGRVQITSRSNAARGTDYIHTLGGLEMYAADWAADGELRVPFQSPTGGTITSISARFRPGGESPAHALYQKGSEASLPVSVSKGDMLELRFPAVQGTTAASLARLALTIE
jgi:hypothetical protein